MLRVYFFMFIRLNLSFKFIRFFIIVPLEFEIALWNTLKFAYRVSQLNGFQILSLLLKTS